MTNPIQFTSRDFESILSDLNADPEIADKPDWFKRAIAGVGDVASIWENASANQAFLGTAFTREAVQYNLSLINYQMTPQVTSSGTLLFDLSSSAVFPHTLLTADQAATTQATATAALLRFEGRSDITVNSLPTDTEAYTNWTVATGILTTTQVYATGEKVRFTTTGALPTGLSTGTDYYAIYVSDTEVKFATTRANAFAGTSVTITDQGSGNTVVGRYSISVSAYQQTSVAEASIGTSDGLTSSQRFQIAQVGVIQATLTVTINGAPWTVIDFGTFYNYGPTDEVVVLGFNTDGTAYLEFGDGTYGAIPAAFDIMVAYAYGGGSIANVSVLNSITVYAGTDGSIDGVTNPVAFTGGGEAQSIDDAQRLGPASLAAQGRFILDTDGETLALTYGGVSLVKVNANVYGVLSAQVVAVANGGGNPSATLRSDLQTYLKGLSILESMLVSVEAATLTAMNAVANVHLLTGFSWATVSPYVTAAIKLFFAETGHEILSTYNSSGVADAITLINAYLGTSFGSGDYTAFTRLLDIWANDVVQPRGFGDLIEQSDLDTFVTAGVAGVDYAVFSYPTLPYQCANTEISTQGTVTLTQV